MSPDEKKALVEQILVNPMFDEIMNTIEREATELCIYAQDEQERAYRALEVQAVRAFRSKCEAFASTTPTRKGAPA